MFGDPDVAGLIIEAEDEAIGENGGSEAGEASLRHFITRAVEVVYGEWIADRPFGGRIEAPGPDAAGSVTAANSVEEIAVRGPPRAVVA